jgi:hypothetical protein
LVFVLVFVLLFGCGGAASRLAKVRDCFDALGGLGRQPHSAAVFGYIDRRLQWRWDNASMLALRAKRMVYLLETDPGFVVARKARIRYWRDWQRKHEARAWAQDVVEASLCGLDGCPTNTNTQL